MLLLPTLRALARRGAVLVAAVVLPPGVLGVAQPGIELLAPDTARRGDTVDVVLRVRNDGSEPIVLELPGRPLAFDVVVTREDGSQVWRRLASGFQPAILMQLRLAPGESREFSTSWALVDGAGQPVAPGRYTLRGTLDVGARGTRRLTTAPRHLLVER